MNKIVTKWFDYGQSEMDGLSKADPELGQAIMRLGQLKRTVMPDVFAALVHAVIGQLISVKAADTIWSRMQEQLGAVTPYNIARYTPEDIRACGLSMKKARYISDIAKAVSQGELRLDELHRLPDEEVIERLTAIKGVGVWTAEMLLIHSLERPDVVSWGDLAIRKGMMKLYGISDLTKQQFDRYRIKYSPYGTVASIYLWEIASETSKAQEAPEPASIHQKSKGELIMKKATDNTTDNGKESLAAVKHADDLLSPAAVKQRLIDLSEAKYRTFSASLIPNIGIDHILGVRLPEIRKLAKSIARGDWRTYMANAEDEFFEETMLQGMVIGYVKTDIEELLTYTASFVPKINNWSVCDTFCSGLKAAKLHPSRVWDFLQPYLQSDKEYEIRFGVVMLLTYFVNETYIEQVLQTLNRIEHEAYYVKMAVAWAISICYIHLPDPTMRLLQENHLDTFTYNKALQKITESLRIDPDTKDLIRSMKRKPTKTH